MGAQHHVVLFPFMAEGHLIPFLALAKLIEQRKPDYIITLVNTPLNIQNLRSSLPPNSNIHLRELPFSTSGHGLPPNTETTAALPFHLFPSFFYASETLQPAFERLISDMTQVDGHPPLCIIADNFFGWTVDVAKRFGVFHSVFMTGGAYGYAIYFSLWRHLPHNSTSSDEFPLPDFPEIRIDRSRLPKHLLDADGTDSWSVFLRRQIEFCFQSDALLINTVQEFEKTGISMLRRCPAIPISTIGPLIRHPSSSSSSSNSDKHFIEWLDIHPPESVLYISFGSQNTITASQMLELATGLEASGKPCIWVIRPPVGFDIKEEFRAEWLPEGFEDRMREKKQGLLVHGWAPQLEILSHGSTGAFLSHCGWNSVLESLSQGVPIIGWPLSGDQLYNSMMLVEEMGVCEEVARGNKETTKVEREGVERVIGLVMGGTERGREMRRKAGEIREMLRGAWKEEDGFVGSSVIGLNGFFETALSMRKES